jgi:glutaminyl-tRNA synthetase
LETVRWLGFEPWRITYSSDNFQRLYELAVELTRRGKAYVCTCDAEKIKEDRGGGHGNPVACEHRDRPVEESLREFERMKNGEYAEKTAALRMKMDLSSGNPYMWDTIAYRVKNAPHHRTGDKWSESTSSSAKSGSMRNADGYDPSRNLPHVRLHALSL